MVRTRSRMRDKLVPSASRKKTDSENLKEDNTCRKISNNQAFKVRNKITRSHQLIESESPVTNDVHPVVCFSDKKVSFSDNNKTDSEVRDVSVRGLSGDTVSPLSSLSDEMQRRWKTKEVKPLEAVYMESDEASSSSHATLLDLDRQTKINIEGKETDSEIKTQSRYKHIITSKQPASSKKLVNCHDSGIFDNGLLLTRTRKSQESVSVNDAAVKRHKCTMCDKSMSSRSDLIKHIRTHTGEKPYACTKCDARFTQLGSLRAHETRHSGLRPFVCQICRRAFSIKERLKVHMRVHTGVKPFRCKLCDKSFARGSQLIQHKRVHSGHKPYACSYCDMKFSFATNLKLHEKKHTGAKDFKCPRCFKGFVRQDALRRHIQSYHENERPMHCPICDKSFKGHLGTHLRVHTQERPYQCSQCSAAFAQNSQLTVHQRTHSGDKPYRCQVCPQKFAHSTALKVHLRQHTGEKPYRCPLCSTMFNQLPHLKKHLRTIHQQPQPYMCGACKKFFKTKNDREKHVRSEHAELPVPAGVEFGVVDRVRCDILEPETQAEVITRGGVPLSKLRAQLAILLGKISSKARLNSLGFGKRLIDEVLKDSLEAAGKTASKADGSIEENLCLNIQVLLDWTVPEDYMEQYRKEGKCVEEILEELVS